MNATPVSPPDFTQDQINVSDSDTNLDEDDASEYYQPISAVDDDDDDDDDNGEDRHGDQNGYGNDVAGLHSHLHSNGYRVRQAENGVSSLGLNDDVERSSKSSSEDEEEEEEEDEEERMREAADSAVMRAFREDENRRNAPLTTENAMRVMEAMRGVSFGGVAPDWADRVAENNWVDQLRRLRQPPQA